MAYKRGNTPEDFGAASDGVTDDTAALQAWLDSAEGADVQHGRHLVARGHYSFTGELLLAPTGSSKVTLDVQGAYFEYDGPDGISVEGVELTFDQGLGTITRSAGDFVADGFTAGRLVFIYGTENNDKLFKVDSVNATTITVDAADLVIDEGPVAGCRVEDFRNVLTVGDPYDNRKLFYSHIQGLYLLASGKTAVNGLLLLHSDFQTVVGGNIGASFGRALFLASPNGTAHPSGATNGAMFKNVGCSGGEHETVLMMGNAWTWEAGRVQQSQNAVDGVGMRIYKCAAINLIGTDFSLHPHAAVHCKRAGSGTLHFYSESIGPQTLGNDARVLWLERSNTLTIQSSLVNCAGGSTSSGLHCGYGIYMEDCQSILLNAKALLPQKASVFADADCGPNEIALTFEGDNVGDDTQQSLRLTDLSNRVVNRNFGKWLSPVPPGATNLVDPDLNNWTEENNANLTGTTVPNQAGDGTVQVLELPDLSPPSRLRITSAATTDAVNKGLFLRVKLRLVDFRNAQPTAPGLARFTTVIIDTGNGANQTRGQITLGDNYDWFETVYFPPQESTFDIFLEVRQGWEPIDIAIEAVELVEGI